MKNKLLLGLSLVLIVGHASAVLAALRLPDLRGDWSGTVTTMTGDSTSPRSCVLRIQTQNNGFFSGTLLFEGSWMGEYAIAGEIKSNGDIRLSGGFLFPNFYYKFEGTGKFKRGRNNLHKISGSWLGVFSQTGSISSIDPVAETFEFSR